MSKIKSSYLYALALAAVGVVVVAILQVGPPSSSARTSREVVTAQDGVVQSTVSASGNVQAGTDVDVNFRAGGTLQQVSVSVGQHVSEGQLIASLDPSAAQLALDQAQESLTSAEDQLTAVEDGTATSAASYTGQSASPEFVSDTTTTRPPKAKPRSASTPTTTTTTTTSPTTTTTTPSPASIAAAQASVDGAEASVQSAEIALAETKLYAPTSGTIVSLSSMLPGDSVSAGSTTTASSTASSPGAGAGSAAGAGSGAGATAGGLGAAGASSSSSSSSSSGGSSTPFAEIVNTGTMTMSVAFSESDIGKVKVGQPATVTLDALPGVEVGAHVSEISIVGTTSGGVVSYGATLTLNQADSQIKPGMSASAAVIVQQSHGVTLPNAAVTGGGSLASVDVLSGGKTVAQPVEVGLRGDSRTQILSGLRAGQQVVVTIALPSLGAAPTSTTPSTGTLGGGGVFGGGGGFFGGGGGGGRFLRGGGGGG